MVALLGCTVSGYTVLGYKLPYCTVSGYTVLGYKLLYYTVSGYTVLGYKLPYCTVSGYTVLGYKLPYCTVSGYTVLGYKLLYYTPLCHTVLWGSQSWLQPPSGGSLLYAEQRWRPRKDSLISNYGGPFWQKSARGASAHSSAGVRGRLKAAAAKIGRPTSQDSLCNSAVGLPCSTRQRRALPTTETGAW